MRSTDAVSQQVAYDIDQGGNDGCFVVCPFGLGGLVSKENLIAWTGFVIWLIKVTKNPLETFSSLVVASQEASRPLFYLEKFLFPYCSLK